MKKNSLIFKPGLAPGILLSCILFLFSSCSKDMSLNNAARTPSEKAAAFQLTENVSVPIDLLAFIPCANGGVGENVQFSGSLHILFHITLNDNRLTVKTHNQPEGLKGIGAITGDSYNATGVTQDIQTGSFINGSYTYSYINNFNLIGPGTDNNYLVHENFTVTINANGTVVVAMDNFSVECK